MKKLILSIIVLLTFSMSVKAQIDAGSLMGLPTVDTTVNMNGIVGPAIGAIVYNLEEQVIYYYTSTGWQRATDDQDASEVNLVTAVDMDEAGAASPTNETTVEEAIQAIAPITSRAARVFYPPSIAIDASTNGNFSINLYTEYTNQFASASMVHNPSAPSAIPVYAANELDYYVTYYDPSVFRNLSIDDNGLLNYEIWGQPADYNSLINVVFVVK
ncbi:hypothetical protein [Allomuricauda sp. SCSIO 65647]|uniref:hypothetical protein n=1 Tax=Allomuricauda sp. SCSIO 65647 TaxID=2908843 RepID=UPI001F33F693|nr:hypothetical protein [Muricauda sp. SCSIO 65647]UJH68042.1 hypothetical protein L0P89_02225 [Muricauda sp. SCSIO 65647]